MLTRAPDPDRWESERGHPMLAEPVLAHGSEEWLITAEQKRLGLLEPNHAPRSIQASARLRATERSA